MTDGTGGLACQDGGFTEGLVCCARALPGGFVKRKGFAPPRLPPCFPASTASTKPPTPSSTPANPPGVGNPPASDSLGELTRDPNAPERRGARAARVSLTSVSFPPFLSQPKKPPKILEGSFVGPVELSPPRDRHCSTTPPPPPRYPRALRTHFTAVSRSVKKEKIHGFHRPSIVTTIAPNGYTPGLTRASSIDGIGTANLLGAVSLAPYEPRAVVAAASFRKQRWLLNTNISPLSSGVSPLQHSNTPKSFSVSSVSLKCVRMHRTTRVWSTNEPLSMARRQYAAKSVPSISNSTGVP